MDLREIDLRVLTGFVSEQGTVAGFRKHCNELSVSILVMEFLEWINMLALQEELCCMELLSLGAGSCWCC
jgi:hypothetical protein